MSEREISAIAHGLSHGICGKEVPIKTDKHGPRKTSQEEAGATMAETSERSWRREQKGNARTDATTAAPSATVSVDIAALARISRGAVSSVCRPFDAALRLRLKDTTKQSSFRHASLCSPNPSCEDDTL